MRRRTHYITTNAAGVRDYVTGDSINRIHWPSSARRQRLMVKEFELDPTSDVWIAIDLQRAAHYGKITAETIEQLESTESSFSLPDSTEEYAVSIAASCARYFLNQDRVLGLIAQGDHRHTLGAERGERQFSKLMETLAVVRADGQLPFGHVLAAETMSLSRGITIVAISASLDPEWALAVQSMMRSGLRVVAIFVESTTFGAQGDGGKVQTALSESGAIVRIVRCGEPIGAALE